jgi:hypothetical protein
MDASWCLKVLGAAEGSYFGSTDVRYVGTKASDNSGISFGITQLDTTQAGKGVFKLVVEQAKGAGKIDQAGATKLLDRYCDKTPRQKPTTTEITELASLLGSATAKAIIDKEDSKRADEMNSTVSRMMLKAANGWLTRNPSVDCPSLVNSVNADYRSIFAYAMATLNKRPDNFDTLVTFLSGKPTTISTGKLSALTRPPTADDFHGFATKLVCWTGKNGSYINLKGRLAFVQL